MKDPLDILFYSIQSGEDVEVLLKDENLWATQNSISTLFGVKKANISTHINNIYSDGELEPNSTVQKIQTVCTEGGDRPDTCRDLCSAQYRYYTIDSQGQIP